MNQSPKKFIKILESHGWILDRIKGSHHIMKNEMLGKAIVVPMHGSKDIPKGLFYAMIKQAELTIEDFSK